MSGGREQSMTRISCKGPVRLILASKSPRRLKLLRRIGLEPEVIVSGIRENTVEKEPEKVVMDLSRQKAEHVAEELGLYSSGRAGSRNAGRSPDDQAYAATVVIGADTVVCTEGKILGKPHTHAEAEQMIRMIQGKKHQVFSGVTILMFSEGKDARVKRSTFAQKTEVSVYPMSDAEMREYSLSGEPMDKAGAYAIQGFFGRYIQGIEGDFSNVVGLPAGAVYQMLRDMLAEQKA